MRPSVQIRPPRPLIRHTQQRLLDKFNKKYSALKKHLESFDAVAIAFSGGVDSTFLAKAAVDVLGVYAIAVTVDSEAYPPKSILETRNLAARIGIWLIELLAKACDIPGFRANEPDRCYHCKKELFTLMLNRARQEGITVLMDGSNANRAVSPISLSICRVFVPAV